MLASHLSRPRVRSLVDNWNLSHSQTDPWFRVTLVSKEEVLQCNNGVVGAEKDQELLKWAKKPMKFLWDNNFRWQSSSRTAGLQGSSRKIPQTSRHSWKPRGLANRICVPFSLSRATVPRLRLPWAPGGYSRAAGYQSCKHEKTPPSLKDNRAERAARYPSAPSTPPHPHPQGRKVANKMEGIGTLVMWLNHFSLPASTGLLLLSTCVSRGEHMGLGDLMFHGLLGCQNILHYYLLQHSRWSSLRKKKTCAAGP